MNAKMSFVFAVSAAALLALAACHGGSDKDDGRVVYVAGGVTDAQGVTRATLWENGAPRSLSQRYSEAYSVCVSGGDVYVAGAEWGDVGQGYRPVLWTNGAAQYLPSESPHASATSVHVSGGRVCVAGFEEDPDAFWDSDNFVTAKVWVDGRGKGLGGGEAVSVYAAGDDVYAAGIAMSSDLVIPTLWKNDTPRPLAASNAFAMSVFVSGGDVYVAGVEDAGAGVHAVLWKNDGAAQRVGGQDESGAYSVFVSGKDVYVAGLVTDARNNEFPTVWKNGAAQRLGSAGDARAHSVFVTPDGDVYAAGVEYDAQDMSHPRLWKNGAAQGLGGEAPHSYAHSVFVAWPD